MKGTADTPFGPELPTIPLVEPPLAIVLAQVRYSPVLAVAQEEFVASFQQAIIEDFPLISSDIEYEVALGAPDTQPQSQRTKLWRFRNVDQTARVSLASGFVALETSHYEGHEKFFEQLRRVLGAVGEHVRPVQVQRTGIRYVQRLMGDGDLGRLNEFFIPEILGIITSAAGANLDLSLTEARHVVENSILVSRWGRLAPGVPADVFPPVDEPSWVFDIDVFDEQVMPFQPDELLEKVHLFSRRQYRFFRWAVTSKFLERFGASAEDLAKLDGGESL